MLAIVHARKLAGNGEDEQTEQKERHVQKKEIHNSGDNNILSERVRSSFLHATAFSWRSA